MAEPLDKDDPKPQGDLTGMNPLTVIREAMKAVPIVGYALGVAGIAAAASLVLAFLKAPIAGLLATIVMFVFMAVLYVFSRAALKAHRTHVTLANVFLWTCVSLFIAWSTMLTSSVFFNKPKPLPEIFRDLLGTAATSTPIDTNVPSPSAPVPPKIRINKQRISFDELPVAATVPMVEVGGGKTEAPSNLAERPSIVLDGATLVVGTQGMQTPRLIYASRLEFRNGARIVTNGSPLELNFASASTEGDGPHILSYEEEGSAPQPAQDGMAGVRGGAGGKLTLRGALDSGMIMRVDLRGQNGGAGGNGRKGTDGAAGAAGQGGSDSLFDCRRGGGSGEPGKPGGDGEPGGRGGDGGNGGDMQLLGAIAKQRMVTFVADGGKGGPGGQGGAGGAGGPGGPGGTGTVYCRGGPPGPTGATGREGSKGEDGKHGTRGASREQGN